MKSWKERWNESYCHILLISDLFVVVRRRQWHPTPVLLPGKSHGWRSLVGCSPCGREESDTTEQLHFHFHTLEKEMATHSSVLPWRIPGTGEPGGLPSMGSHRVEHDWRYLAAAAAAVANSHPTAGNPMDYSTPSFPVLHHLPKLAQTYVHWFGDSIQPSHPLAPFSSCPQSFPESGSFPMSWLSTLLCSV